jgi:hypothetical protein
MTLRRRGKVADQLGSRIYMYREVTEEENESASLERCWSKIQGNSSLLGLQFELRK